MRQLIAFMLCWLPVVAYANVVWPSLYLEARLFSWWVIAIGLFIEFFFIKRLFLFSSKKTAVAVLLANIVSSIAGVILIPLAGLMWEIFPGLIINWAFSWGSFNPVNWAATFFLGCLVNGLIEGGVYKKWLCTRQKSKKSLTYTIILNPVKHGYVKSVVDWEFSTFHHWVKQGLYPLDWGDGYTEPVLTCLDFD